VEEGKKGRLKGKIENMTERAVAEQQTETKKVEEVRIE
jgi:hypothetical protein